MKKNNGCSRREFFKTGGAVGVGALLSPLAAAARPREEHRVPLLSAAQPRVPTRPFGRTGVDVPILAMGGMFDIADNQLMLRQAIRWGVTYWDTADCYQHGSETGIGKYFARYPQDREKVFLVTKSDARNPDGMTQLLDRSLQRMNTTYVDLYFVHGVRDIHELGDATRRWAAEAKAAGKIKFFGFSAHSNVETLLAQAPGLGYIDGIMMSYNFRNMFSPEMKAAVNACGDAGIGLTAMKTQAGRSWLRLGRGDKTAGDLMERLMAKGLTEEQAKLKAVWTDPRIASICSQMTNMTLLKANAQAATDPAPLTTGELRLFRQYARETAAEYCSGCSAICEAAVGHRVPIADIMRYHMYSRAYGRLDWARENFNALPGETRRDMGRIDLAAAERACPRNMPIARLVRRAMEEFS